MHETAPLTDAWQRRGDASYISVYPEQSMVSADFFKDNHCPITLFCHSPGGIVFDKVNTFFPPEYIMK
jgi:hypothetical protein